MTVPRTMKVGVGTSDETSADRPVGGRFDRVVVRNVAAPERLEDGRVACSAIASTALDLAQAFEDGRVARLAVARLERLSTGLGVVRRSGEASLEDV